MTKEATSTVELKLDKVSEDVTSILDTMRFFMDTVSKKFEDYDGEFRQLNKKYDHLIMTMDGFISKLDKYEVELAARDSKINRLEKYIEALAKKAGVDLNTIHA